MVIQGYTVLDGCGCSYGNKSKEGMCTASILQLQHWRRPGIVATMLVWVMTHSSSPPTGLIIAGAVQTEADHIGRAAAERGEENGTFALSCP